MQGGYGFCERSTLQGGLSILGRNYGIQEPPCMKIMGRGWREPLSLCERRFIMESTNRPFLRPNRKYLAILEGLPIKTFRL